MPSRKYPCPHLPLRPHKYPTEPESGPQRAQAAGTVLPFPAPLTEVTILLLRLSAKIKGSVFYSWHRGPTIFSGLPRPIFIQGYIHICAFTQMLSSTAPSEIIFCMQFIQLGILLM